MKTIRRRITAAVMVLLLMLASVLVLASCDGEIESFEGEQNEWSEEESSKEDAGGSKDSAGKGSGKVKKDGTYDQKDDVAEYLSIYKKLPKNYIKKEEAKRLGWNGGSVERVAPGKTIGGDHFGNYEKKLPNKSGRSYYECDIDTLGKKERGPKRIIYSNDGLIYYTGDHYDSFQKMPQSA